VTKKYKNIFFTSDWHIGHANSIVFDNRPFKDLDHMHRVLINNYNSSVKENDICYFLGDVGFDRASTGEVISKLNGTKVVIVGNHDFGYNALYDLGFDIVLHQATLFLGKNKITLSHCPLMGVYREDTEGMIGAIKGSNWHGEHKHQRFSVKDEGQFHLHGHIHSPNRGKSTKILDRQFDVGVPANNYRPVSLSAIESWIANYKKILVSI
jgi:calcineurin-like phosphoesterase family protein